MGSRDLSKFDTQRAMGVFPFPNKPNLLSQDPGYLQTQYMPLCRPSPSSSTPQLPILIIVATALGVVVKDQRRHATLGPTIVRASFPAHRVGSSHIPQMPADSSPSTAMCQLQRRDSWPAPSSLAPNPNEVCHPWPGLVICPASGEEKGHAPTSHCDVPSQVSLDM
jgi:hypothetical protein